MNKLSGIIVAAIGALAPCLVGATATDELKIDRNVFVAMRDGTRLATDLYLPVQTSTAPVPVIVIRTPYGKDVRYTPQSMQPTSLLRFFVSHGYAVAVQDKRGRHRSEGT
jgi:predicted acyl esterase